MQFGHELCRCRKIYDIRTSYFIEILLTKLLHGICFGLLTECHRESRLNMVLEYAFLLCIL